MKKTIVRLTVVLCCALLASVCIALGANLFPDRNAVVREPLVTTDGTTGMILIDIADRDTADHYHVTDLGVYVLSVSETSQAYQAGIRSGDRIVSANGVTMGSSAELEALQNDMEPGGVLQLRLSRGPDANLINVSLSAETDRSV